MVDLAFRFRGPGRKTAGYCHHCRWNRIRWRKKPTNFEGIMDNEPIQPEHHRFHSATTMTAIGASFHERYRSNRISINEKSFINSMIEPIFHLLFLISFFKWYLRACSIGLTGRRKAEWDCCFGGCAAGCRMKLMKRTPERSCRTSTDPTEPS